MDKKRVVFLFGAGAVIDWGAPTTEKLTELMINTGYFCKDNKTRVTQHLYNTLIDYLSKEEVNFETILNVIEELIVFYASIDYNNSNSIIYPFLKEREALETIFNFSIKGEVKHRYSIIIPQDIRSENIVVLNGESPKQHFLQLLYADLLSEIIAKISEYSYYTDGNPNVVEGGDKEELNTLFSKWIKGEIGKDGVARIYTLNYDRLFSVILKNRGLEVFEGAECNSSFAPGEKVPFNLKRIFSDFEAHCHYNLHGSAYWEAGNRHDTLIPTLQYYLTGVPVLDSDLYGVVFQTQLERGKIIFPTNIIAGYQKTQKTAIAPFRQLLSTFDTDCLFADKIIIVGYSFGDEHLNESIKTALVENSNVSIEIVDPSFMKKKMDKVLALKVFSSSSKLLDPKNVSERIYSYLEGSVIVKEYYFKNYLLGA